MIKKKRITDEEKAWKDKAYSDRIKDRYFPLLLLVMVAIVVFGSVG